MMIPVVRATRFPGFWGSEWIEKSSVTSPAINIVENDKEYKVEVAAPGLTKEDFHIEMHEDDLTISMEKKAEKKEENAENKYLRRDFSYVSFSRRMILPDDANKEGITARMENGVLSVFIPKKKEEPVVPKEIAIN